MSMNTKSVSFLIVFMLMQLSVTYSQRIDPGGIVLTWQNDPTSTMTIDWHVLEGRTGSIKLVEMKSHLGFPIRHPEPAYSPPAELYYRPVGGNEWHLASG